MDGHSARNERVGLIGRERDLALVHQRLGRSRLVTIAGLGGIGKTALAREVAAQFDARNERSHFVDLAPVTSQRGVTEAIAAVVGAADDADHDLDVAIASTLAASPSLVVLDNFEQVLEASPVVSALLVGAPPVRILTTSRVALGLEMELTMALGSLDLPATASEVGGSAAGALFLERAASLGRSVVDEDDLVAVVEICRKLDGLPLAIELAAAWSGILTPRAIVRRLLEDRLDLTGDDPRHSSVEAVVESTLELVEPAARAVFPVLGVFAAPFDER